MNDMNSHSLTLPKALVTLVAGALFGFGLSLATMVQPDVVLSFLRFQDWGLMPVSYTHLTLPTNREV